MPTLVLAGIVAVVALAGIIVALVTLPKGPASRAQGAGLRTSCWVVFLIGVVGVALTIPAAPPFAQGMRLGLGFGEGILIALVALCVLGWYEAHLPALAGGAALRLAALLVGVGVIGLLKIAIGLHGYTDDALLGAALGVMAGLLVGRPALRDDSRPLLDWFATVFVILAAAQYLCVHHFPGGGLLAQLSPLLVAGGMVIGLLGAAGQADEEWFAERRLLPLLISAATALVVVVLVGLVFARLQAGSAKAAMLPTRLNELSDNGLVLAIGAVLALVILWLLHSSARATDDCARGDTRAHALAALLVILLVAVGFRQLAGWGLALVLLPLAVAAVTALAAGAAGLPMLRALQLGALVLAWRLLLQRAGPEAHPEVDQHYMLIGLLVGLAGPLMLRDMLARRSSPGPSFGAWLGQAVRVLAPLALVPLVVLVVWDFKAVAGLYWGFVAAGFYVLYAGSSGERRPTPPAAQAPLPEGRGNGNAPPVGSLALLMGLIGVQFLPVLMPLTDLSRASKLVIVLAVMVVGGLWALLGGCASGTLALRDQGEGGGDDAS
jgi:hypothetical protein